MKEAIRVSMMLSFAMVLTACNGPFSDYSASDLRKEYRECDYSRLTAAGAQRCNNLKKECDKRRKDTGFRC